MSQSWGTVISLRRRMKMTLNNKETWKFTGTWFFPYSHGMRICVFNSCRYISQYTFHYVSIKCHIVCAVFYAHVLSYHSFIPGLDPGSSVSQPYRFSWDMLQSRGNTQLSLLYNCKIGMLCKLYSSRAIPNWLAANAKTWKLHRKMRKCAGYVVSWRARVGGLLCAGVPIWNCYNGLFGQLCTIFLLFVLGNMFCLCNEGIILCYLYTHRENIVCTSVTYLVQWYDYRKAR